MFIIAGGTYELKSGMMVTVITVTSYGAMVCSPLTGSTFKVNLNSFKE